MQITMPCPYCDGTVLYYEEAEIHGDDVEIYYTWKCDSCDFVKVQYEEFIPHNHE